MIGDEGGDGHRGPARKRAATRQGRHRDRRRHRVLLLGATTVFAELQNALDRIWRAPAREKAAGCGLLRTRLLSFGMILGIGFLLLVSLVVSAALAALGSGGAPLFGGWERAAAGGQLRRQLRVVTALFAMIYKLMPRVQDRLARRVGRRRASRRCCSRSASS